MSILFYIGLLLLCGLLFGRIVKLMGLPNVTGYLLAGLIVGPYVLGIVSQEAVEGISIVSEMALGFIALSIGAEFKLSYFKKVGISPVIIAFFGATVTMVLVTFGLLLFGFDFPVSIILGAIASATAPAATVMVIKQYRADGPVTKMLLSVVAIDDAIALILFGFAVASTNLMVTGGKNIIMLILDPFIELGLSILLGVAFALLMLIPLRFFKKESNRMCAVVGVVFVTSALSEYLGASTLLTCMVLGAILVNISEETMSVFEISDKLTPPIYMLFFLISGAKLNISIIPSIGLMGVIYLIMRVFGKVLGSWFGSVIAKSPFMVKKYLGWTLLPQAGVAIGLTLVVDQVLPEYSGPIRAVVLCATLTFELIGPVASKLALVKAGEIKEQ